VKVIDVGSVKNLVKLVAGLESRKLEFEEIALNLGIDCYKGL